LIGRSFSDDGGGGHNPIEAAQLHCAVLCGPHVQNLQDIFDEMGDARAVLQIGDEQQLVNALRELFTDKKRLVDRQEKAAHFARDKAKVLERVMDHLSPLIQELQIKDAS